MSRTRTALLVLVVFASVAALAAALWDVDPDEALAALRGASWQGVPLLVGAFALNHLLRALRWHVLLASAPLSRSLPISFAGFLAITLLPLRLGEAVRPTLHATDGVPLSQSVAALLAERLLDLLALLALLLGVTLFVDLPTAVLVEGVDVVAAGQRAAAVAVGVLAVGILAVAAAGDRLPFGGGLAGALRELARQPSRGGVAMLLTAAVWASAVAYVHAALLCFPNTPRTWEAAATTWAAIISGITVLPTPGFFGAYEASGVAALRLLGTTAAVAATAVLFLHLAYIGFAVAVGLPALLTPARPPRAGDAA